MNRSRYLLFASLALPVAIALTAVAQTTQTAASPTAPAQKKQAQHEPTSGEQVFAQNCSRCHAAPDGFSPHISGTVVLHMRVRASLSQHDEQELLRFFNP